MQQRQGFLDRLNTAQRVILFICGLVALGLIAFPPWTCGIANNPYSHPDFGYAFIFNWDEVGGTGCHGVIMNILLGQLLVPLAVAPLGYFVFKKPVVESPEAASSAASTAASSTSGTPQDRR